MGQIPSGALCFPSIHSKSKTYPSEEFVGLVIEGETFIYSVMGICFSICLDDLIEIYHEDHLFLKAESKYVFVYADGDSTDSFFIHDFLLESSEFQKLVLSLKQIKPTIQLDSSIQHIIDQKYIHSKRLRFDFKVHKWKFDFKLHTLKLRSEGKIVENSGKTMEIVTLLFVALLLFILAGVPILGGEILASRFGTSVPDYREGLLIAGAFLMFLSMANIFLALMSRYRGHLITIVLFLVSIASMIIAFV